MAASRSAHGLAAAALVGGAAGLAAALGTLLDGAAGVAQSLRGAGYVQLALATAFVPLAFAASTAAWLGLGLGLHTRALRDGLTRRSVILRRILLSWLLLALPGYALAFSLTFGTSAFRPGRTEWQLAAVALAAAPPALFSLELLQRGLTKLCTKDSRRALAVFAALALALFTTWALATASLRERYGATQLLGFGLTTAGITLLFSVYFRSTAAESSVRSGWLLAAALVVSGGVLLLPADPAVVAHFHAERPTRWFARALVSALPDADTDGTPANFGLLRGGDCDDDNPARHPLASDVPGNGVDENCFHGDAVQPRHAARALQPVAERSARARPHNVVLVVVDSLRFDRRFANGVDPVLTPALERLASGSVSFSAFRTCSPRTRESVPDLLGAGAELSGPSASGPNAIEALARGGARTVFVASEWLARYATVRGFELSRLEPARYGHFADAEVAADARAFLREKHDRPFFLFTHWLGAHEPYAGDKACLERAASARERYDCALGVLDRELAALVAALDETGLAGSTVLAVTADHGEEFGEHGGRYHATTLYDEILRVPLVVRAPGRSAELVRAPAGCGDVMPTLLALAGHRNDLAPYGRDVLGAKTPPAPQLARTRRAGASLFEPRAHAVVHREHKLLYDATSGVATYFDLARDPEEREPLASAPPDIQRELLAAMDAWLSAQAPATAPARPPVLATR